MVERFANEWRNIRPKSGQMMIFRVLFLSLANGSAGSKPKFWAKKGFTILYTIFTQVPAFKKEIGNNYPKDCGIVYISFFHEQIGLLWTCGRKSTSYFLVRFCSLPKLKCGLQHFKMFVPPLDFISSTQCFIKNLSNSTYQIM